MKHKQYIDNFDLLLDDDGEWPNFHDAEIISVNYCTQVYESDGKGYLTLAIGPSLTVTLELAALEKPYVVTLKFNDCTDIQIKGLSHQCFINDLIIEIEERECFKSGEPLPPYILVNFETLGSFSLMFKCFSIEVLSRIDESLLDD